jgi:hypothetical protein
LLFATASTIYTPQEIPDKAACQFSSDGIPLYNVAIIRPERLINWIDTGELTGNVPENRAALPEDVA